MPARSIAKPTLVMALAAAVAIGLGASAMAQGPGYGPGMGSGSGMMGGRGPGYGGFGGPMQGPYGRPPGGYYSAPPGDAAQGRQLATAKCAACHGPDGNGVSALPLYPKLAGQNPDYLYSQLLGFKSGAHRSEIMAPLVVGLSDADAADLARFYSEQPIRPSRVTDRAFAREGQRIFSERGGPGVPPCATCHSDNGGQTPMMGMMGSGMMGSVGPIPNLYGQHAAYTNDQLNRYASGARPDGVMNSIAAALSESERKAVAEYLAGLR